jgi:hypothetical protein
MDLTPRTTTHHTVLPAPFPAAPSFALHLTRLADTLFIWVGTAPQPGTEEEEGKRKLAGEWAVAMPSYGVSGD